MVGPRVWRDAFFVFLAIFSIGFFERYEKTYAEISLKKSLTLPVEMSTHNFYPIEFRVFSSPRRKKLIFRNTPVFANFRLQRP